MLLRFLRFNESVDSALCVDCGAERPPRAERSTSSAASRFQAWFQETPRVKRNAFERSEEAMLEEPSLNCLTDVTGDR